MLYYLVRRVDLNFTQECVMKENCIIAANLGENALLVSYSFQQSSQSQKKSYGNRPARVCVGESIINLLFA